MFLNYCLFLNFFIILAFSTCGDKIIDPHENCDDGNSISGDGCSSSCTIETDYNCYFKNNHSICYINKPFSAYLTYIPISDIELNLTFSKPFNVSSNLIKSRMNVTIPGLNASTDFTWSMQNMTETMFKIILNFNVSFLKQTVFIDFNNSDNAIADVFSEPLGQGSLELSADIPIHIQYTDYEENFMVFIKYFIDFVFILMVFFTLPLSILNSLTVFWSFLGIIFVHFFF